MKLLITSIPWTETESPLMAPGMLKAECVKNGIDTVALDLNQEVLHFIRQKFPEKYSNLEQSLMYDYKKADADALQEIVKFMAGRIMSYNPTHVAFSLLTYASQYVCEWLCFHFRLYFPHIKIIIGGPGVFNTLAREEGFGDKLLKQKQIDYYVKGDGDDMLSYLVKTGDINAPGVNDSDWKQIDDINNRPFPLYEDYDWNLYKNPSLSILGSRGCVRKCSFCDVHSHWSKFQWRRADDIFAEMVYQNQSTGVKNFRFQDSLINGNQNEFMKLMRLLSKHNLENPDNAMRWTSFFIFRPKKQMHDGDWELISHSALALTVGVESLVDEVRMHMRKKFTNDDLDYCLEKCQKYQIKVIMLLIVGYVTDNEETNKMTCEWFEKNKHYANNPITNVNFGGGLGILPNTELFRNQDELGIVLKDMNFDHDWHSIDKKNTHEIRMRWMKEQKDACRKAGFNEVAPMATHLLLEKFSK